MVSAEIPDRQAVCHTFTTLDCWGGWSLKDGSRRDQICRPDLREISRRNRSRDQSAECWLVEKPGSGRSTLLRRLETWTAASIADGEQMEKSPSTLRSMTTSRMIPAMHPLDWLSKHGQEQSPGLGSLEDYLSKACVLSAA
jgi:hypothetical protein